MKKVLLRTILLTLIAIFINGIKYKFMTGRFDKEVVLIIGMLALIAAIPIILGYISAYFSLRSSNSILLGIKFILFLANGLLIIGTTILTLYIAFEETDILVSLPYLVAGTYIYYETIKLIRQPPSPEAQGLLDSTILDDFFIDAE